MTIESLTVDCHGMFQPGQAGVGIGRAVKKDGLRVINFTEKAAVPQTTEVLNFVQNPPNLETDPSLSCCLSLEVLPDVLTAHTVEHHQIGHMTVESTEQFGNKIWVVNYLSQTYLYHIHRYFFLF